MTNIEFHEIGAGYIAAGVSIIPIRCDGSKGPAVASWNPYRARFATAGEMIAWRFRPSQLGIGLVCGVISGGLEVLDFDENADTVFAAWVALLPPAIRGRLAVIETGGLGFHVPYRCEKVCRNTKIAMSEDQKTTFIETRGEGGYIVGVGSPLEVHSSGSPYVQVAGEPLPAIPTFTNEERKTMWQAAASFDQRSIDIVRGEYVRKRALKLRAATAEPPDQSTPWGDFDVRADWDEILSPHGWTTSDGVNWSRPGKGFGVSAKLNLNAQGVEVLTVFSTGAGPLETGSYGPFNAYKTLAHGGDAKQATIELRKKGYGRAGR